MSLSKSCDTSVFTLKTADVDGVVAAVLTSEERQVLEGAALSGDAMTGGALSEPRNITVGTLAVTGAYVAGSKVEVRGPHPTTGKEQIAYFTLTDADGDEALVGAKCFGPGPLKVILPPSSAAIVHGSVPGPWAFSAGDALVLKIDGGADETATWDAAAATAATDGSETWDLTAPANVLTIVVEDLGSGILDNISVEIEDGVDVADISAVTAAELVALLDPLLDHCTPTDSTGTLVLTCDGDSPLGTNSKLTVGGTANAVLLIDATTLGTGDVKDSSAVDKWEFKAIVEADTNAEVRFNDDGTVSVYKPSAGADDSIAIQAGSDIETIVGLDTDVHAVGQYTIGVGVAVAIVPPTKAIWSNAADQDLVCHLANDNNDKITTIHIDLTGRHDIAIDALHASNAHTSFVPIAEN